MNTEENKTKTQPASPLGSTSFFSFERWWKRKMSLPVLGVLLIGTTLLLCSNPVGFWVAAVGDFLMLTVPCGIKLFNLTRTLWIGRQMFFAGMGFTMIAFGLSNF